MNKRLAVLAFALGGTISAATIATTPLSTTIMPGAAFAVSVDVSDVSDLYAFQFDLGYSPGTLSAMNVSSGSFINSSFLPGIIDNTAGTISFVADSMAGPVLGASGSGTLATVNFFAIGQGISPITLSNIILLDSSLGDIPFAVADGSVTVTATPEPGSLVLVLVAFLALAAWARATSGLSTR